MATKKKPVGGGPTLSQEAVDPEDEVYSLEELVRKHGDATEVEALAFIGDVTKADLVEEGTAVGTSRIDVDAARIYGRASTFLAAATDEQRDALPGISEHTLRVAIPRRIVGCN